MIQLRAHRHIEVEGQLSSKPVDVALTPNITVENHAELFKNLNTYLAKIPEDERWNIHYTLGHGVAGHDRDWGQQDIIPFDIDQIETDEEGNFNEEYLAVFFNVVKVDRSKCVVVASGNGIQILIQTQQIIQDKDYFQKTKKHYKTIAKRLEKAF
jgi:hypothetical protein